MRENKTVTIKRYLFILVCPLHYYVLHFALILKPVVLPNSFDSKNLCNLPKNDGCSFILLSIKLHACTFAVK